MSAAAPFASSVEASKMLLRSARHWFTVPGILRQFDAMAAAKMNTMHW